MKRIRPRVPMEDSSSVHGSRTHNLGGQLRVRTGPSLVVPCVPPTGDRGQNERPFGRRVVHTKRDVVPVKEDLTAQKRDWRQTALRRDLNGEVERREKLLAVEDLCLG